MKVLLFLVISAFTLTVCISESSNIAVKSVSEVNLYFEDYDPANHKSFIDIKIENGINPIEEQVKISEDGSINYNFINSRIRELILDYEDRTFSLIISPGEEINVTLTVEQLIDRESQFVGFEVLSGINVRTNNLILTNTPFLDSLIQTASSPFQKQLFKTDFDYKEKRIEEMNDQLSQFADYCGSKNIKDESYINWAMAQIKYKAGEDLCVFPFMGTLNRKIDDESEYFNFIKIIHKVNLDILRYHAYLKYIEALTTSFEIIGNISDTYSSEREMLKKESASTFPILFSILKRNVKTLDDEILFAFVVNKTSGASEKYRDSIKLLVTDETLLIEYPETDKTSLQITTLLQKYDIPEDEKQQLIEIYEDLQGKVVFHDFWFASCVPCMKELPNYNDLMKFSKVDNVEFLFYGAYMEEKEWKKVVKELGIKGKHHLLTKNQIAFFEKYLKLRGFPHHHLIKDNGQIGEKVGMRVFPENFEKIDDIIQRHHGT